MTATGQPNLPGRKGRPPKITGPEAMEELTCRRAARQHVVDFCAYTHPAWKTGPHHKIIGEHLEALERREIRNLMIHAPRRHSKSEIASRRFPSWFLGRNPSSQVLLASYSDEIAEDLSRNVRNVMRDEYYRALFPETTLCTDTTAAGRWETSAGGVFVAVGTGGAATGRGAHLGIIDDPHKGRAEADSARIREVIWQWYHGVFRLCMMKDAIQLIMCTRWHEDDLAGRLLTTEGQDWTVLELAAIENEHTDHEKALWESEYSLEHLRKLRSRLSAAGRLREWKAQYQQKPTAEEGIYILREWFRDRYTATPGRMNIYITTDFAVTEAAERRDPDWTCIVVCGVADDSKIYVLDSWRKQTTPDEWVDVLLDMAARWKPLVVFGEKGLIRRAVEPFLGQRMQDRGIFLNLEWIATTTDKAARGRALQGMAKIGRILLPNTEWANELLENMVGFPTAKHEDGFDAMSLLCLGLDDVQGVVSQKPLQDHYKDPWQRMEVQTRSRWKTL